MGHCSTGQSPQRAVVPMEEEEEVEEEEEEEEAALYTCILPTAWKKLDSHCTDFHEIWCFIIFRKNTSYLNV